MTYEKLAGVYDALMEDAPYQEWQDFTMELLQQSGKSVEHIVDLGCGTGRITTSLAQMGYNMTGVDFSEDMLSHAQQLAVEKDVRVQWIHQDLRELTGFHDFDVVISYCDVLNYITSEEELLTVFTHVQDMLSDEGLFIFDVHSLYHIQNNLVGETFAAVTDELSYIWFCTAGEEDGEVFHDLTFFVSDGDSYARFDEYHHQRTFSAVVFQKLLNKSGLQIRHLYGDFSLETDSVHKNTERIFFVVEKQPEK